MIRTICQHPLGEALEPPVHGDLEALLQRLQQDRLEPGQPRVAVQELFGGEVGRQPYVAGQVTDPAMDCDCVALCIQAEDGELSRRRAQDVEQTADGGGLARAVGPQEAEDLAPLDLEGDVPDRLHRRLAGIGLDQVGHVDRHSRFSHGRE